MAQDTDILDVLCFRITALSNEAANLRQQLKSAASVVKTATENGKAHNAQLSEIVSLLNSKLNRLAAHEPETEWLKETISTLDELQALLR